MTRKIESIRSKLEIAWTKKIEIANKFVGFKLHTYSEMKYLATRHVMRIEKILEVQGIIRKVDKPTEWVHPLVIIEQNYGDLHLCLNSFKLKEGY